MNKRLLKISHLKWGTYLRVAFSWKLDVTKNVFFKESIFSN